MCLMVAKLAEALSVRTHSSSRKIMSNTQCRPFSIIQWPRTIGPRAIEGATVTIGCQLDIAQTNHRQESRLHPRPEGQVTSVGLSTAILRLAAISYAGIRVLRRRPGDKAT